MGYTSLDSDRTRTYCIMPRLTLPAPCVSPPLFAILRVPPLSAPSVPHPHSVPVWVTLRLVIPATLIAPSHHWSKLQMRLAYARSTAYSS